MECEDTFMNNCYHCSHIRLYLKQKVIERMYVCTYSHYFKLKQRFFLINDQFYEPTSFYEPTNY